MLATVMCPQRDAWLDCAILDPESIVREAAIAVASWVAEPRACTWPSREEVGDAREPTSEAADDLELAVAASWGWEYTVEVWREDGLCIGVFLSTSRLEDDEHAKKVALGQAVLATASGAGDGFDPATAATFIVEKRRTARPAPPRSRDIGR